jgi:hypothetical protein
MLNTRIALMSLVVLVAGCGSTQDQSPASPEATLSPSPADLAGRWGSACVDPGNGQAFRLLFDLTETTWSLAYEAFADAACATPSLTVQIDGGYALGNASAVVAGAREGRFDFATKTVTPHNAGVADFLAQACGRPGFVAGEAADITGGCAGLGAWPVVDCPSDHDIVLLDNAGTLHFGARPQDNNMCTPDKRPTAPGLPLTRR